MSCHYEKTRLDLAIDYVRGDLPEDKQDRFEAHYLECEECFSAVRFAEKTAVTMHHYGASIFAPAPAFKPASAKLLAAKPDWLTKLQDEWEDIRRAFSTQWKTAVPALATYVLLIAALGWGYHLLTSSSQLAHQNAGLDSPGAMVPESSAGQGSGLAQSQPLAWLISNETKANAALYARLEAVQPLYEYHNYFSAAEKLAEIVKDFPEAIEGYLYLGVIQVRENQPAEAIKNLGKVLELNPQHPAAQWYLAQGHLMQGDLAEAQSLLAALADRHDSQYGKPAAALLQRIASNK
jgi:tetratricopeptide (TPR) repeat protein